MRWPPWRKPTQREKWQDRYGGYAPYPANEMTKDEAKEYLTVRHACGCVENWWYSPPSGTTCRLHIGLMHPVMPTYFLYATSVLHGEIEGRPHLRGGK